VIFNATNHDEFYNRSLTLEIDSPINTYSCWNNNCVRKYTASLLIYEILETTFLITLNATNANSKFNFVLV